MKLTCGSKLRRRSEASVPEDECKKNYVQSDPKFFSALLVSVGFLFILTTKFAHTE